MNEFVLLSNLQGGELKLKKPQKTEILKINRPFYRDVLEVHWFKDHYKILRTGVVIREAKFFKNAEYIGSLKENLGIMASFDIMGKSKKLFEIKETDRIVSQEFEIFKAKKKVGKITPMGIYVPVISEIGKGLHGQYEKLPHSEEEVLIMAVLALAV